MDVSKGHGWLGGFQKRNAVSAQGEKTSSQMLTSDNADHNESVKDAVVAFAQSASVLGLKNVVDPKSSLVRRAAWLCCVLAGAAFLCYHIWNRVAYYQSNPVSVNVEVLYSQEPSLVFPAVTVCNINIFRNSSVTAAGVKYMAYVYSASRLSWEGFQRVSQMNLTGYNWSEFFRFHGHRPEEMFSFNQDIIWEAGYFLSLLNFTETMTSGGRCYTFNAGTSNLTTELAAKESGLQMVLNAETDEYFLNTEEAGFTVMLHSPSETPVPQLVGTKVTPGSIVDIAIWQTQVENLPPPHGNCHDSELAYFPVFSQLNCLNECYFNFTLAKCGCQSPPMNYLPDVPSCSPITIFPCLTTPFKEVATAMSTCRCSAPCRERIYNYAVSHAKMTKAFKQDLMHRYPGITESYIDENVVKVKIFYKTLNVEKMTQQKAYTMLALFADIGGALGLILGSTLMTAVEIIDFVAALAARRLCGGKL